jgi:hypothetical protein
MRITIEDLEALKELNDELEENHVETEKAMQEDIGHFSFHLLAKSKSYVVLPQIPRMHRSAIMFEKLNP